MSNLPYNRSPMCGGGVLRRVLNQLGMIICEYLGHFYAAEKKPKYYQIGKKYLELFLFGSSVTAIHSLMANVDSLQTQMMSAFSSWNAAADSEKAKSSAVDMSLKAAWKHTMTEYLSFLLSISISSSSPAALATRFNFRCSIRSWIIFKLRLTFADFRIFISRIFLMIDITVSSFLLYN